MDVSGRIEQAFTALGYRLVRRRFSVIVLLFLASGGLGSLVPGMTVDTSPEASLHEHDPARLRYDSFRQRFDREDSVVVIIRPPEIFESGFLAKLDAFHRDLERDVPYVEEITSLINARDTRGEEGALIVGELFDEWPDSPAALTAIRARALSNPLYRHLLISEDARSTALFLRPFTYSTLGPQADALAGFEQTESAAEPAYLSEAENRELAQAVYAVAERYDGPDFPLHVAGIPAFRERVNSGMSRDVNTFTPLSLAVIALVLLLLFRRVSSVVLPLVVVVASLVSTLGIMVWLGIPFSLPFQILPSFLLAVGVCDSVHILTIAQQRLARGVDKADAIAFALGHSGLAVVLTSLTTAAGLTSFRLAELATIADLGRVASIGVLVAMLYSLLLLPALLAATLLTSPHRRVLGSTAAVATHLLVRVGDLATRHPRRVLAVAGLILILGAGGLLRLRFSHDLINWFPGEEPVRIATELLGDAFGAGWSLEVVIDSGRENGLHEPAVLARIEAAMRHCETLSVADRPVKKTLSLVDVVKEIHQALNENRPEFYALPPTRELIAQELLLFENAGSEDLERLTDPQVRTARLTIRTPRADAMLYQDFLARVEHDLRRILGDGLPFHLTGGAGLMSASAAAVVVSMTRSYVFALLVITPMLFLLIGSLRRGAVAMIANLVPVVLVLGLMGWLAIPIDASTLLVGAIVIGLAVDDTIHFMHRFGRGFATCDDVRRAVRETLETTGSALLFTTLILGLGFAVFLFAYMVPTFHIGLLISFATVVAFAADVVVAPALLVWSTPIPLEDPAPISPPETPSEPLR